MVVPSTPLDGLDSSQAEMMEELVLCLDSDDNVIEEYEKYYAKRITKVKSRK